MNDLNITHILRPEVAALEHGVRVARTSDINSGTFVCHLTTGEEARELRWGYFYKNASNGRIAFVDDARVRLGTVRHGEFIISFDRVTTERRIDRRTNTFTGNVEDFRQDWFNADAEKLVRKELLALEVEAEVITALVARLQDLDLDELKTVIEFVDNEFVR